MEIMRKIEFDYGHRIPNHKSKCYSPLGHRGMVELYVEGNVIEEEGDHQEGMVIDFTALKSALMECVDGTFDHAFIVYEGDDFKHLLQGWEKDWQKNNTEDRRPFKVAVVNYVPTAENIACHIFRLIDSYITGSGLSVTKVIFWETPNNFATAYYPDAHSREFHVC